MAQVKIPKVSIETVKTMLDYSPETGIFTWRRNRAGGAMAGDEAGHVASAGNGYRYLSINNNNLLASRVAWAIMKGEWSTENIGYRDGDKTNLRFENLIALSDAEVARKGGARASGSSGVKGVSWSTRKRKWIATITRNYRQEFIGEYATIEEAKEARRLRELEIATDPIDHELLEKKAAAVRSRRLQKALWRALPKPHYWASFEDFVLDIGPQADGSFSIEAADSNLALGPGNFRFVVGPLSDSSSESRNARGRALRLQDPDVFRNQELKRTFGITLEQYGEMLEAQEGACAICGEKETDAHPVHGMRLMAVDHCHDTGLIRGLLCGGCNRGIGNFGENISRMEKGIQYLKDRSVPSGNSLYIPETSRKHPERARKKES